MKLLGKIILKGALTTRTGLHIGGSKSSLSIGGIDNNIIKTADGRPYIPGSSLKGKLRSLLAKKEGSLFFQEQDRQEEIKMIEQKKKENPASAATLDAYLTRISAAKTDEAAGVEYLLDLFGHSADSKDENVIRYSRLIVRDALLLNGSSEIFERGFTHAKWENVINRRTGTAEHPRQMERVPVGAKFDLELIYNLYDDVLNPQDKLFSHLQHIVFSLKLLEDDFIGGSGSRGYGQVDVEIDLDATCLKQIRGTEYEEGSWLLLNEKVDALESFQKALQNF